MTTKLVFEWSILILAILFLIYAMVVIKEEKKSFLENAIALNIGIFKLSIPSWWGKVIEEENHLKFERQDTRYDWFCEYQWFEEGRNQRTIEQHIGDFLEEQRIVFDQDGVVIANPVSFKKIPLLNENTDYQVARVEGCATQDGITRIYFDCFLLHPNPKTDQYFLAFSWSSVLNGAVEGPYFEESLYLLEKIENKKAI
tara:strand:- start:46194 stop:46790 length:597 start_codon:yes stop_codon:yes gene_type:complete